MPGRRSLGVIFAMALSVAPTSPWISLLALATAAPSTYSAGAAWSSPDGVWPSARVNRDLDLDLFYEEGAPSLVVQVSETIGRHELQAWRPARVAAEDATDPDPPAASSFAGAAR